MFLNKLISNSFYHFFQILILITLINQIFTKDTEDAKAIMAKTCCKADFQMLVLTAMDKCFSMNSWKFSKEPHEVCRQELFGAKPPSNEVRHKICDEATFKDKWVKCIDKKIKELATELKSEYKDDKKLKKLPDEKLQCYKTQLSKVACS